jgi:hypothetical protein
MLDSWSYCLADSMILIRPHQEPAALERREFYGTRTRPLTC